MNGKLMRMTRKLLHDRKLFILFFRYHPRQRALGKETLRAQADDAISSKAAPIINYGSGPSITHSCSFVLSKFQFSHPRATPRLDPTSIGKEFSLTQ